MPAHVYALRQGPCECTEHSYQFVTLPILHTEAGSVQHAENISQDISRYLFFNPQERRQGTTAAKQVHQITYIYGVHQ